MHKATLSFIDAVQKSQLKEARGLLERFQTSSGGTGTAQSHIVFVLDESGSMTGRSWNELMSAFHKFLQRRMQHGGSNDLVSVVQFSDRARRTHTTKKVADIQHAKLQQQSGGTQFIPALNEALNAFKSLSSPADVDPILIFMSDGANGDGDCTGTIKAIQNAFPKLRCHMIFFGAGGSRSLEEMAKAVDGKYQTSVDGVQLMAAFEDIALGVDPDESTADLSLSLDDCKVDFEDSKVALDDSKADLGGSKADLEGSKVALDDSKADLDGSKVGIDTSHIVTI
jgi:uncharacterized protein YegL